MALDFNNRNSDDPNGIYSLDTTKTTPAWVKDNDWSTIYTVQAEARKAGANNQVRVATAITNDGRKFEVIIGADGQPISQAGDVAGTDDDVARKWKDRQSAAAPPGGAPTKTINGKVFRWNPETRAYDIPTEEAPAAGATAQAAAPGGKPFIDDGPEAGATGRRWGWNPETRLYDRDLGPSPSAQKPAPPQVVQTSPVEPFIVERMPDGTLKTTPNPNYKGPEQKPGTVLTIKGQDGKTYLVPIDAQGNPGPARDSGVPGEKPIPGNAPVYTPTQGEADLGLQAFARSVRQRTDLSKEQQDQLIREAHQTATTVISRQTSTINTQENTRASEVTQRGQDAQLAAQRLSAANSVYGNALQRAGEDTKYSVGPDAMAVAPYYTMLGLQAARMFGGMDTPPRVQNGPAIQAVQQQGLPTVSGLLAQSAPAAAPGADPAMAEAIRQQAQATTGATSSAIAPLLAPPPPVAASPAPPVPPASAPAPLSPGLPGMMSPNSPTIDPAPAPPIEPAPPALGSAPAPAPEPAPPAAPPLTESGQRVAEQGTVVLRHRVTGETRIMTRPQWEQEQARAGLLGRAANMLWEEVNGAAPDAGVPPIQGPLVEEQAPPAPWAPEQPSGGAFPPLPVVPRAGTEAGGNVQKVMPQQQPGGVAAMLGGGMPQQQAGPTGALGTQLMAADGAYDPTDVNQAWIDAGIDPQIAAMFGGGRRVA